MIQQETILKVADNSGAKTVRLINVLGGFKRKKVSLGDILVVSVQNLRNKSKKTSKVKKKEVYKALLIRVKTSQKTNNGFGIYFQENSVVLLNKQGNPIGSRIAGPLSKKFKKKKFNKFASISAGFV
jgi:large subunit ribosomal protein L14